jgi:hypothetical protein
VVSLTIQGKRLPKALARIGEVFGGLDRADDQAFCIDVSGKPPLSIIGWRTRRTGCAI